eukprot:scaffold29226_cov110-Isochrysis_galbana.AAC.8
MLLYTYGVRHSSLPFTSTCEAGPVHAVHREGASVPCPPHRRAPGPMGEKRLLARRTDPSSYPVAALAVQFMSLCTAP